MDNHAEMNIKEMSTESLENLLIETYRGLSSRSSYEYNRAVSVICHVCDLKPRDSMVQQLLHDCICQSRIFLYGHLLSMIDSSYNPAVSFQDAFSQNLYTSGLTKTILTRQQKEIFDSFQENRRIIVSAPTSFGKTRIIREIVEHNEYRNIVLIMPTVSLLSEQYQDIKTNIDGYIISKSSKVTIKDGEKYLLILTPERMSSFLEDNPGFKIDFFVMDEVYKADYKLRDGRFQVFADILYRLAGMCSDFYLIGPYIDAFSDNFVKRFDVKMLKYDLEIVQKDYYAWGGKENRGNKTVEGKNIRVVGEKFKNLMRLCANDNVDGKYLIYRYQKQYVEDLAIKFASEMPDAAYDQELYDYLSETISPDWGILTCLKKGAAFHHGAMPRHIQDLVVDNFNKKSLGSIDYLFCTTSLTEGVNSAAKNVVLYDKKIGSGSMLGVLDRKNIEGRAGRFMQHFVGRIFYLEEQESDDAEVVVEIENFDSNSPSPETLIQVDELDLSPSSSRKLFDIKGELERLMIPLGLIKKNRFVSIEGQKKLIQHLRSKLFLDECYYDRLIPDKEILQIILSTIYEFLFSDSDKGRNFDNETGKNILINLTKFYVYYSPGFKGLFESDTAKYVRPHTNSRIRFAFELISKYFEFVWPKYLKCFEELYNFVAAEKGYKAIDASALVAKLEYGTTESHEILLKDAGVPNELIKKISVFFKDCGDFQDIRAVANANMTSIKRALKPVEGRVLARYL
jgi:hypothetical protein